MLGLAIPWVIIMVCFLIGAIINVIEGEKAECVERKVQKEALGGNDFEYEETK